ncbi:MAG TPA: phytoene/squalene synthase family protein [Candidatus Acidoferrales bacterium]|nr:phytoene/squalene synthase family protein [Candidatus Acidoferrales bacterium]
MPDPAVVAAYLHCRKIARSAARNFYYGFVLLPEAKRDALCALYAFMRGVDDISDEPGALEEKRTGLRRLRGEMDRALAAENTSDPVWIALRDTVSRFQIPHRYLHDLISGAEMDLTVSAYETFRDLRKYCYHVAGAVGLCCLYVFEFTDARAPERAEKLGIAFQLTNILRDVRGDYAMGRTYLPREDLVRFGCDPEREFKQGSAGQCAANLLRFEAERAWQFYREGSELLPLVNPDSRAALWALARIYSGILQKIDKLGVAVVNGERAGLSVAEKSWILLRARLGWFKENDGFEERDGDWRRTGGAVGSHGAR